MNFVRLNLSKRTKKILYPFRKKIKDIDIDILIKYTLKSPADKKLKIIVAHRRKKPNCQFQNFCNQLQFQT